jgi:small-conductance mechanosensitive channel
VDVAGIRLIGATSETAVRILLTLGAIGIIIAIRVLIVACARAVGGERRNRRVLFWIRQGSSLTAFVVILVATISIWFDSVARLTTVAGFVTAGLAVAAQRAVTAFAGYLVIMRGKTFTVGDRIKMGGVRGDVIALGFLQTRILEMGQPPDVNEQEQPGMWVRARQYSGRIVTVTNDKVFDTPVYNFTRELPFIWEEISLPVPYGADRSRAEEILTAAARHATQNFAGASDPARSAFDAKYHVHLDQPEPRVYWRLTDNWLELTVRFLVPEHGIREIKDAMSRHILSELDAAHIEIASATLEIVGLPPVRVQRD